ncbi:hypothetical protein KLP40_10590 [Hymenobacter sp. NST-14]|uniref:hypothetical protein n=1 Tax=Hymenobacter piscis TaxID=2839984 RepID=UPI001C0136FF|nr:hypothetical protein [Hymenobacter piscis]MBT9393609.1 hypothetical protein [Hymenobacter piscis]
MRDFIADTVKRYNRLDDDLLMLKNISSKNVKRIKIIPLDRYNSLIDHQIVVNDRSIIEKIVESYGNMRKQRIEGDGKLGGEWQIELIVEMNESKNIRSFIFANEKSSLVFILNMKEDNCKDMQLADCLVNTDVARIVLEEIIKK